MAKNCYIQVILPLKLEWEPFYSLPEGMEVEVGSRVRVIFARAFYVGCVSRVDAVPEVDPKRILPIEAVEKDMPLVQESEIAFWRELARYYLCTVGEVYKVAYPRAYKGKSTVKLPETALPPVQSQDGELADALRSASKTVLLRGQGSRPVLLQQARETTIRGMNMILTACQKQIDNLHKENMLDISTDIDVLEQMLKRDGYTENEITGNKGLTFGARTAAEAQRRSSSAPVMEFPEEDDSSVSGSEHSAYRAN